jgi:predicted ABC-type ATPase
MSDRNKKSHPSKTIEIVAGPNGSRKTTFASVYLLDKLSRTIYLNPDRIAAGIAPLDFERASFHAGRVLIGEIKSMIAQGDSFAFESTLPGRKPRLIKSKAAFDKLPEKERERFRQFFLGGKIP